MKSKSVVQKTIMLMFLVAPSMLAKAQDGSLENYRWTSLEARGEVKGRHENAFIEFQDKFYLLGGRGVNPVNVYDPKTNQWETRAKTPLELHHFQAVVYEDAIYILGAMTGPYPVELPVENIWIYYPIQDKWVKGSVIPEARRRGSSGVVLRDHKIYVVCGIEYGHTSGTNNNFDVYDIASDTWTSLTKAPNVRDHFPAIVVNDKLYCMGGRNTSIHHEDSFGAFFFATIPFVDVYDFNTGKWHTLKNEIPFPTAAGGIVHMDGCILYMGGEGSQLQAYNQTQCLDLSTGEWTQLAALNTGRHGSSAILYKDEIYLAAGSENRGGGNMNSIEKFSMDHKWRSLFDGKSLTGWEVKCIEKDKDHSFWTLDKGTILCNSIGSTDHNYSWLQSNEEYGNFELRLKFRVSRTNLGNSGVQVRSRYDEKSEVEKGVIGWLDGPQVDIEPGNPWRTGLIYDETRDTRRWINPSLTNWVISEDDIESHKVVHYFEDEESGWNDMAIICKGLNIKTIVNNVVVSDYNGSGVLDDEAHKKYKVGLSGHIALQLHKNSQNHIRFKDIEIRSLDD